MLCCHNQWVKPAMTDLSGEHSLNLKLQDRIRGLNVGQILLPKNRDVAAGICPSDPQGAEKAELITDQITSAHTLPRGCKTGQELKSGTLRKEKNKCRTIRFLLRTVSFWSGTLYRLYQTLPSHTGPAMLWDTLLPLAVFLTLTFLSSLT